MGTNDALRLDWRSMGRGARYCIRIAEAQILKIEPLKSKDFFANKRDKRIPVCLSRLFTLFF